MVECGVNRQIKRSFSFISAQTWLFINIFLIVDDRLLKTYNTNFHMIKNVKKKLPRYSLVIDVKILNFVKRSVMKSMFISSANIYNMEDRQAIFVK